jgi:hypothetical protein
MFTGKGEIEMKFDVGTPWSAIEAIGPMRRDNKYGGNHAWSGLVKEQSAARYAKR